MKGGKRMVEQHKNVHISIRSLGEDYPGKARVNA